MSTASGRMGLAVAAICVMLPACGQKGPPLAPLHLVPSAAVELSVRRVGDQARLRFVLPTTNANGPGPVELDRVEIYAVSAAPGFIPPNRELLTKPYLVGQVEVRPPLEEGEQPKEGDTRPSPGEAVFFDDPLTAEKLKPLSPRNRRRLRRHRRPRSCLRRQPPRLRLSARIRCGFTRCEAWRGQDGRGRRRRGFRSRSFRSRHRLRM